MSTDEKCVILSGLTFRKNVSREALKLGSER
jgi:hypothetical protein